jgi:undecaprenyl-diphosphatase
VLLKFRTDFFKIFKSFAPNTFSVSEIDVKRRNWLIYATLGTGLTALPLYFIFKILIIDIFTAIQGDIITLFISGFLIITGIILLKTRKIYGENTLSNIQKKKIQRDSIVSGLVQGFSILPGISRSGVTVSIIALENYNQDSALRLSFLMSVPVAFASIIVDIFFGGGSIFGMLGPLVIIITTFISFIVGYFTIELLLRIAQRVSFGYFCIFFGIVAFGIIIPFILIF